MGQPAQGVKDGGIHTDSRSQYERNGQRVAAPRDQPPSHGPTRLPQRPADRKQGVS